MEPALTSQCGEYTMAEAVCRVVEPAANANTISASTSLQENEDVMDKTDLQSLFPNWDLTEEEQVEMLKWTIYSPDRYDLSKIPSPAFEVRGSYEDRCQAEQSIDWDRPAFINGRVTLDLISLDNKKYEKLGTGSIAYKFELFSGLPTEICRLIWKFALPGPNIIELIVSKFENTISFPTHPEMNTIHPGHLLTCYEAYEVFLESYGRIFVDWNLPEDPFISSDGRQWNSNMEAAAPKNWIGYQKDLLIIELSDVAFLVELGFEMNLSQFDNLAVRTLNLREEFQGQDSMAMQHIESLCTWAGPQLKQLTVIEGSHNFSDDMWDRHPDSWRVIEIESSLMEAITYVDPDHLTTFTSTSRFFSRYLDSSNSIKRKFKRMLGRNPHLGTPSCRVALMGSHERRIPNENAWFIPRKPEDHPAYKWERMSYHTTPCLRDTSTPYFIFTNKWKNPEKCVHVLVFWSYEEDLAVYVNADGTLQSSMDYLSEFFEGL